MEQQRSGVDRLLELTGKRSNNSNREDVSTKDAVSLADFRAYMPMHSYIYAPTRDMWPGASVNARVPPVALIDGSGKPVLDEDGKQKFISASAWLDRNKPVEQMTWAPGEPMLIKDRLISNGGWIERPGCSIFNLYRAPSLVAKAGDVTPWLDLVHKLYPAEADHIVTWLAHRVQRAWEKINHALVLGGKPGICKDTILEPVKQAVGPWNFADVSPKQVLGRFNGYLKSVILRVNEARDLGEFDRFAFHDHMKAHIAAPPDVIHIDEKNIKEYYVPNLCGVIITTNHKTDGIYLPADDRRYMVAWSNLISSDFEADYWRKLYRWYHNGGHAHVAEYLTALDIADFDAKAPPPKTQAFWEIANANRAPEDSELADVLDDLKQPDAVTLDAVATRAAILEPAFADWLRDRKNRRSIPHRFEDCGYVVVSNPSDSEGRWKISGTRHTIYGRSDLTERDRIAAAYTLAGAR